MPNKTFKVFAITGVLALAITLSSCGNDEPSKKAEGLPKITADKALADKVPDSVKADGKLVVGTDPSYAPVEMLDTDGKTIIGFDIDLFNAVATKLGLKAEFQASKFGDIIGGVGVGKYEVGVSAFTINDERKTQTEMVSYYSAGTQWATKKGNPEKVDPDNACGKNIAVQRDTVQVDDINARSEKCVADGKDKITIHPYQGQDHATAAVASGKDDAMLLDSPVAAYAEKETDGQIKVLGDIYASAPYGYVLAKGNTELAQLFQQALQALIDEGSYQKILDVWNAGEGAITSPAVNP